MNKKLNRTMEEIRKTKKKLDEWQEHLKALEEQKQILEDGEIIKSIRSLKMDSETLHEVLDGIQKGTVSLSRQQEHGDGYADNSVAMENPAETDAEDHMPLETAENKEGDYNENTD